MGFEMREIMTRFLLASLMFFLPACLAAQPLNGAIIRCGASDGHAFFFEDILNPDGPGWMRDGISAGKIVLIRLGNEWDILFDDAAGASGYRQDGADVIPLMNNGFLITVGAFNDSYVDIYTFDLVNRVAAWTSSKLGPIVPKVAAYSSACQ